METKPVKRRKRSLVDFFTLSEFHSKPGEFRLVHKNGDTTIKLLNQPSSRKLFYPNIFISIVELHAMWIFLIFMTCFFLSWFTFTLLYYIVSKVHGDFITQDENPGTPCVEGVDGFLEMFQFSMETQTTIGYGTRYVTEQCPLSILLVSLQSIIGAFILSTITGVILFKFQSPKKRAHTVLFSKVACVNGDHENYHIEIQILNMQRSQLIDPQVKAVCIMNREDGSGKCRLDMEFNPCHKSSRLFFRPKVYRHLVDKTSPFWDFNRQDFEKGSYEIIVTIDGVDEFTDSFMQARTSFLPFEIKWSRNFKQMTATKKGNRFKLNFLDFTRTNRFFDMTDDSASEASRRTSDVSVTERKRSRTVFDGENVDNADNFVNVPLNVINQT